MTFLKSICVILILSLLSYLSYDSIYYISMPIGLDFMYAELSKFRFMGGFLILLCGLLSTIMIVLQNLNYKNSNVRLSFFIIVLLGVPLLPALKEFILINSILLAVVLSLQIIIGAFLGSYVFKKVLAIYWHDLLFGPWSNAPRFFLILKN